MRKLLLALILCIPFMLQSQDFKLNGTIHDWNNKTLKLYSFYGDKINLLDSTKTSKYGQFEFSLKKEYPKGIYRIGINEKYYLDVIFNQENIRFSTHISDPFNNLSFSQSEENQIYLDYLQKRNYDQYRLELLQPVISYYPMSDPFFPKLLNEFGEIQDSMDDYLEKVLANYSDLFATKLIAVDQRPKLDPTKTVKEQKEFAKQHFFSSGSYTDTALLYTNVITSNIIAYLSLYQNEKLNKEQMEEEFIKAVDIILPAMQEDPKIYEFVVEYLINGFEQFGFNKVITHIASKPLITESACFQKDLQHRIETLKNLVKGKKAPEIVINDSKLSEIKSKYTLVFFYSSTCPHCDVMIPELKQFYEDYKSEFEILSISIDESKEVFEEYSKTNGFKWINQCDFKGWNTQAVIDYGVYVTPNMFLLDKDKIIISKPADIRELLKEVEKLL